MIDNFKQLEIHMVPISTSKKPSKLHFTFPEVLTNGNQRPISGYINENGCLICTSHKTKDGFYPRVRRNYCEVRIHRYIFMKYCEEIPQGEVVRHKCDNPICINPDHLERGTPKDNSNDKIERGRQHSKLSIEQAYKIKFEESGTAKELANKYNVSEECIYSIRNGKSWRWLEKNSLRNTA